MSGKDSIKVKTDSKDTFIKCYVLICTLANRIQSRIDNKVRELDLAHSQIRYLKYLYEHGKKHIPMKEVYEYLSVSRPSLSNMTYRLTDKDFIQIERSQNDDRKKWITLTDKGEAAYLQAIKIQHDKPSPLSEKELDTLYELLNKLNDRL